MDLLTDLNLSNINHVYKLDVILIRWSGQLYIAILNDYIVK